MTTTSVAYDLSDFDLASPLSFFLRPLSPQPDTGGALPAVVLTAYPQTETGMRALPPPKPRLKH